MTGIVTTAAGNVPCENKRWCPHAQDALHAARSAPAIGGHRFERAPQLPARGVRPPQGGPAQLRRLWTEGQDRQGRPDFGAYLAGRTAYAAMINPARGRRLRELFGHILRSNEKT